MKQDRIKNERVEYITESLQKVINSVTSIRAFIVITMDLDKNLSSMRWCSAREYFEFYSKFQIDFYDSLFETKFETLYAAEESSLTDQTGINYPDTSDVSKDSFKASVKAVRKITDDEVYSVVEEFDEKPGVNLSFKLAKEIVKLRKGLK